MSFRTTNQGFSMMFARFWIVISFLMICFLPTEALAGGGGASASKIDCSGNGVFPRATAFLAQLGSDRRETAL